MKEHQILGKVLLLFGLVLLLSIGNTKAQDQKQTTTSFIPAEFPGGMDSLANFLSLRLRPIVDSLAKLAEDGKVWLFFKIDSTGSLSDFRIKESFNHDVDSKILEILKEMPSWIPATNNGKAVNMVFQLPIKFDLTSKSRRKNTKLNKRKSRNSC